MMADFCPCCFQQVTGGNARRAIFNKLAETCGGPISVRDFDFAHIKENTVGTNLRELLQAGYVIVEGGREKQYTVSKRGIEFMQGAGYDVSGILQRIREAEEQSA